MATVAEVASGIRAKFIEDGVIKPMLGGREDAYRVGNYAAEISEEAVRVLKTRDVKNIAFNSSANQITIYTNRRITKAELEIMPAEMEGYSISYSVGNIENVGATPPQAEYAPYAMFASVVNPGAAYYACGSSISVANEMSAGTVGALVLDEHGELHGLTNNHVVGGMNHTPNMMPIVAPGVLDSQPLSIDPFTIGHFTRLMPLMPGDQANVNVALNLDAAIFKIKNINDVSSMQGGLFDTPNVVMDPQDSMIVEKVGRTTGHTVGRVVGRFLNPEPVFCENKNHDFKAYIWFDGVYLVHGTGGVFSDGGDSGSLVVGRNAAGERVAVGIVFAGGPDQMAPGGKMTMILPIRPILEALNLTLVSGHNAT